MKFIKKVLITLPIFFLLFFFLMLAYIIAISIGGIISPDVSGPVYLLVKRFYPLLAAMILLLWAKKKSPGIYKRIHSALSLTTVNGKKFIIFLGISLAILYTSFLVSMLLGYSKFKHFGNTIYSSHSIIEYYLLVWLLGNLCVAIGEEIIFRGFLINYITVISRSWIISLLIVSLVFSTHYYPDLLNNLIAFIAGLATGYAYLKFESLYPSIGIHLAFNIFNATIASEASHGPQLPYLMKFDYPMITSGFGAYVDLFIIIGMAMILVILYLSEKRIFKKNFFKIKV